MNRALYILVIVLIPIITVGSDYNFKRKKIYPRLNDTTNIFVYETSKVDIYFSQKDLLDCIKNFEDSIIYRDLIDTLCSNNNFIHIKSDTIYDKIYELDLGNNNKQKGEFPSRKDKRDRINLFFSLLATDLILKEKFLLKIKSNNSFYTDKVIIKKENGLMGSEYLSFYFDKNVNFFMFAWALGE